MAKVAEPANDDRVRPSTQATSIPPSRMRTGHSEFAGQRVTVMGLGRFGGGSGVIEFLHSQGAEVTVTDCGPVDEYADVLKKRFSASRVHWHLGGHQESDFLDPDLLIVNPAVPPGNRFVELARSRGVAISTEIGLFWERCRGRIAGVTGTNGKSTTATLLHDALREGGRRIWLGGNIGGSLLMSLDEISADDWVVLELSSFQLMWLDELQVSPTVALVTNFSPNHLDWHTSLNEYRHAKQTILRWQRPDGIAVLSGADEVCDWPVNGALCVVDHVCPFTDVPPALRGTHQSRNIATAATAARAIGVAEDAIARAVSRFEGLPHRLQFVGEVHGRRIYNDSAATTPESTLAALDNVEGPLVLLVGGADKGVNLSPLAEGIQGHAKAAVLMGDVAPQLEQRLLAAELGARHQPLQIVIAVSFAEAVSQAMELSSPGDAILLSPGCSSYGWFANFVERGKEFVRLIQCVERIPSPLEGEGQPSSEAPKAG